MVRLTGLTGEAGEDERHDGLDEVGDVTPVVARDQLEQGDNLGGGAGDDARGTVFIHKYVLMERAPGVIDPVLILICIHKYIDGNRTPFSLMQESLV